MYATNPDAVTGPEVESLIADLSAARELLSEKDRAFATNLIEGQYGFKTRGFLTPKQHEWAKKMLVIAVSGSDEKQDQVKVGGFSKLLAFFQKANQHLKYPRITVVWNGMPVQVALTGNGSKQPGTLNVTDGKPYGFNKYYGRVGKDGVWTAGRGLDDVQIDQVHAMLLEINEDPAAFAKKYGQQSGFCCFCNSQLTDDRSLLMGYGPVCAKHWHLPWGKNVVSGVVLVENHVHKVAV